nr:MAG TPA: hypothetical protein [Caudoviricetes sp.]
MEFSAIGAFLAFLCGFPFVALAFDKRGGGVFWKCLEVDRLAERLLAIVKKGFFLLLFVLLANVGKKGKSYIVDNRIHDNSPFPPKIGKLVRNGMI